MKWSCLLAGTITLAACGKHTTVSTPMVDAVDAGVASVPAPAAVPPDPQPPKGDRGVRGLCSVEVRIKEILAGESATVCGPLGFDPTPQELTAARECVLQAMKDKKRFSLFMKHRGIDSRVEEGIVGRGSGAAYRAYWIHYDGCPSGCGDADPHSTTSACASLTDLSKTAEAWPPVRLRCEKPEKVDACP